ncbi:hypothetical protein IF1G_00941 [Cordyceps javanica]|uniref:Pierisin-like domain-containing protein n=1 Tax=Cordyceps javanica TaxID=43265 RepID=A0A545WDV3_9HYPO|nr:hypothetical protein IF1G_00941 [Cordyceps javanica]TQW12167.1 hypothetical protein IF2G_00898 [Cordyceps javanica]
MRSHLLLPFLAVSAFARPQDSIPDLSTISDDVASAADITDPVGVTDTADTNGAAADLGIDEQLIGEPVFEIILDSEVLLGENDTDISPGDRRHRRQASVERPTVPAAVAAKNGKYGVLFRGDSAHPSQVFRFGFAPQDSDKDLLRHLSSQGSSAFVFFTTDRAASERYAFGRPADKNAKGYVYAINSASVPDGYWVPGLFPRDAAVRSNQEFAVPASVAGSSISHAYEFDRANPSLWPKKIENAHYAFKSLPRCTVQKRAVCDPAKSIGDEEPGRQPSTGEEKVEKKKPGALEEEGKDKYRGGEANGARTGIKIRENRFLQWLGELDPESLDPLVESIRKGELTAVELQMGFKRALSQTIDERWGDFESEEQAKQSLLNIGVDLFSPIRYKVPTSFYQDVVRNLLAIAKEIRAAETPEEKLRVAQKDVNAIVKAWSYTPVGAVNEAMMREPALDMPPVQTVAVMANKLWSYTPIGWLINNVAPIESLLRRIDARKVPNEFRG